nr:immunoglobulin light chain junction region [Macaca mulatta]MOX19145.1 immunoglobulin light chain junction region [Macaca mulatta]MOX19932.1 immunoglobulin light chain junction region [Macaca mulatta]MOX20161.1 immunoglobulin light chain junction region [Macaca mulatta]MOX20784.1 immunoglobulin light chain junction region [Macaca mulatta]
DYYCCSFRSGGTWVF